MLAGHSPSEGKTEEKGFAPSLRRSIKTQKELEKLTKINHFISLAYTHQPENIKFDEKQENMIFHWLKQYLISIGSQVSCEDDKLIHGDPSTSTSKPGGFLSSAPKQSEDPSAYYKNNKSQQAQETSSDVHIAYPFDRPSDAKILDARERYPSQPTVTATLTSMQDKATPLDQHISRSAAKELMDTTQYIQQPQVPAGVQQIVPTLPYVYTDLNPQFVSFNRINQEI